MPTVDSVLQLARSIALLSPAQLRRIETVVHFMSDEDLKQLEDMLLKLQEDEVKQLEKELEVRKQVESEYKEYKADKARTTLQAKEKSARDEDTQEAESLLNNM